MRERLVAAFVGLTVLIVALYGIPRAYFLADLVRHQESVRVERTVALVGAAVQARTAAREPIDPAYLNSLTGTDEWIRVNPSGGEPITSTDGPAADDGDVWHRVTLPGYGTVTMARSGESVQNEIAKALLPLVLLGLGLVLLAGLAGFVVAGRLARPFQDLADAARGFGAGRMRPDLPTYRIPEAQAIGSALVSSGANLEALLRHERELAVHASHELRTPVTALRLELEDLALWPETPPKVATELTRAVGQLDRLSSAVGEILTGAREQLSVTAIDLDLDALLADTVHRLGSAGLRVTHRPVGRLATRLDPQPVIRLLAQIVSEAGARGGEVVVSAQDRGTHLEVRVEAGSRAGSPGTDAVELASALGGRITTDETGAWVLRLPKTELRQAPSGGS